MRNPTPALLLAVLLAPAAAGAADDPCDVKGAGRVVAIGDVHGAYKEFLAVLRIAGLIDDKERWSGGRTYFVQTGDLLDRGSDTRQVLDLMLRLEGEARKAGGRVLAVLGNHEAMNVIGDLRYVSREEYKAYATPDSQHLLRRLYRQREEVAKQQAKDAKQPFDEAAFSREFETQFPPGYVERIREFSAEGLYGKWLRERPPVVKIGGVVFLHGGLTPEVAALGCDKINDTVRREIGDDLAKTRESATATLAAGETGPLWFRGMAREDEAAWQPSLERVLAAIGARTVVIGHTVTGDGRITPRFAGRVVMIDVGMNPLYGSNLAALEIGPDGAMAALYKDRREQLGLPRAAALARADGR